MPFIRCVMMNCKWVEALAAILVLVFTFWPQSYSKWVIVIAALVVLGHALFCNWCHHGHHGMKAEMPAKKRRR